MTKNQFAREQLRLAREKELRLLAESKTSANPGYVRDAVDWVWSQLLERKLRMRDSLPFRESVRLSTLAQLYSCSTTAIPTSSPAENSAFSVSI